MIKLSQFENEDKGLPPVLLYPIENGYIHFNSYRCVGTELHLRMCDIKVSTLRLNEKEMKKFIKDFNEVRLKNKL